MIDLQKHSNILYSHPFTVTSAVNAVEIGIVKIHREMKDLVHAVEPKQISTHKSQITAYEKSALDNLEVIRSRFLGESQKVAEIYQSMID